MRPCFFSTVSVLLTYRPVHGKHSDFSRKVLSALQLMPTCKSSYAHL
ncbi:hypothetical protein HMPREF9137_0591 [Prevotella denticola F0289]|nr:hypothetical protein HMPREF9137_0591 [Prevotella denticola F0289]